LFFFDDVKGNNGGFNDFFTFVDEVFNFGFVDDRIF
jgi:hypothetical protein